jgi:hypothetical protein
MCAMHMRISRAWMLAALGSAVAARAAAQLLQLRHLARLEELINLSTAHT